jgi:hypothetical protein
MKTSIGILAAAAIALFPANASARHAECFHHRGETVADSSLIRVFYTDAGYYACKRGSDRYLHLGYEDAGHVVEESVEGFAFAGNLLAYRRVHRFVTDVDEGATPTCGGSYAIRVVDMRTRRSYARYDTACEDDVAAIVLRRDGAAAWVSRNFYGGTPWSLTVEGTRVDDGATPLSRLKLTAGGVSWLHGADPRWAPLPR